MHDQATVETNPRRGSGLTLIFYMFLFFTDRRTHANLKVPLMGWHKAICYSGCCNHEGLFAEWKY